jgi:hypothetical protein
MNIFFQNKNSNFIYKNNNNLYIKNKYNNENNLIDLKYFLENIINNKFIEIKIYNTKINFIYMNNNFGFFKKYYDIIINYDIKNLIKVEKKIAEGGEGIVFLVKKKKFLFLNIY